MAHPLAALLTGAALAAAAAGCAPSPGPGPGGFRPEAAWEHLLRQCAAGPRVPGTSAHRTTRDWLLDSLATRAPRAQLQEFQARTGAGALATGWNIVATWPGEDPPLLLGAHWDCRALADRDPDPALRSNPVPGANDGASGVAVLLEVARLLHERPPPRRTIIALFDLEDQGDYGSPESFCLGSQDLARRLGPVEGGEAIILDMVGAADMVLVREGYSARLAPRLTGRLWSMAARLGLAAFRPELGGDLTDDHLPFLRKGWEAADVVDMRYPHWHTAGDTPDKCSAASLAQAGQLVAAFLAAGR